jgi:hypothetical protein
LYAPQSVANKKEFVMNKISPTLIILAALALFWIIAIFIIPLGVEDIDAKAKVTENQDK